MLAGISKAGSDSHTISIIIEYFKFKQRLEPLVTKKASRKQVLTALLFARNSTVNYRDYTS